MTTFQTPSTGNTTSNPTLNAGDIAYYRQRNRNRIFESVWWLFVKEADRCGLTKKAIALRLGKEPSQITRWLSGPGNWTLDTLSDLLLAMDAELDPTIARFSESATPNYVHPYARESWTNTAWTGTESRTTLRTEAAKTQTSGLRFTVPIRAA
jgi:hypothetical protein